MPRTVYVACAVSFVIGLVFVFVAAPHPWGWEGIDQYHQLALTLARTGQFPTLEVPWGYAYFLAFFYRLFGDRPWIPLVVQVALNTLTPALTYIAARAWFDARVAGVAALLVGLFSFNTVYASTQSSDAVCTVVYMTAVVLFASADGRLSRYAVAGLLTGIAAQFRPNLIVVPPLLAALALVHRPARRGLRDAAALVLCAAVALTPWTVRNYRLTHAFLPTSAHGGVQLWYGTLQVRDSLSSRARSPRTVFAAPAFDYTSLDRVPLVIDAELKGCAPGRPEEVSLTVWSDRDQVRRGVRPMSAQSPYRFEVPLDGGDATIHYYFTNRWDGGQPSLALTPREGADAPFVYFVSQNHLGDMDVHEDVLDVFDVARLLRHQVWQTPLPFEPALRAAGVGSVDDAVRALVHARVSDIVDRGDRATLTLDDGSSVSVPRDWTGRITDLDIDGVLASSLLTARVSMARLTLKHAGRDEAAGGCADLENVRVNDVFYRQEPHWLRRYTALALDNIRRDPAGFVAASAFRAVRLFVIAGDEDRSTSQQFERSGRVYAAALAVSGMYLVLFVVGVVIATRRRYRVLVPLALVLTIPLTLAPVLTNMRYTVTVQPLLFMFIATTLIAIQDRLTARSAPATPDREGSRTARLP